MRPLTLFVITLASVAAAAARAAEAPATTIDSVSAESVSTDTETTTTFHDEVVATGNDLTLTCDFPEGHRDEGQQEVAGTYENGVFKFQRMWNGDETDWGLKFGDEPVVLRVTLATY